MLLINLGLKRSSVAQDDENNLGKKIYAAKDSGISKNLFVSTEILDIYKHEGWVLYVKTLLLKEY